MDATLRAGVIGLGLLGRKHADYLAGHADTTLICAAEPREDAAAAAEQRLGISVYRRYEEMLAREQLDLVVVATPDPHHVSPVTACAEAGVPYIVVEKPLATSVEDAEAMVAACARAGSRLWVYLNNRTHPMDVASRYVIQEGLIGRPVYAEARLDDNISVPTRLWGARSQQWAAGSSTAHFLLSHVCDTMRWLFEPAEVEAVYAITQNEVLGYTPDLYDAYLFFTGGLKVRVKADWIKHMAPLVEYYLSFLGDRGSVYYHKLPGSGVPASAWQAYLDADLTLDGLAAHQLLLSRRGARAHALLHTPRPDVGGPPVPCLEMDAAQPEAAELLHHIIVSIREGSAVPSTWQGNGRLPTSDDGLQQTRIVCAIIESARQRREVPLS